MLAIWLDASLFAVIGYGRDERNKLTLFQLERHKEEAQE